MKTRSTSSTAKLLPPKLAISKPKASDQIGRAKKPNDASNSQFNIESVVCGDRRKAGSGMTLLNLKWYGSEQNDGGVESYYEIDPDSIVLTTRGGRSGGNWRNRAVTDKELSVAQNKVPRVNILKKKRRNTTGIQDKLRGEALKWLAQNRGCALTIGGPGDREKIEGVEQYFVREYGETFVKQNDGNCMTAAIANAVKIVSGREVGTGLREYFVEENSHYQKIREATLDLHRLRTGVEMRKLPKCDRFEFDENPFAYLATRKGGIFVTNVFQLKLVLHTIVVDGNRKLIIDSAEEYPIRLSEDLLRQCGDGNAEALRVGEVRQIISQKDR